MWFAIIKLHLGILGKKRDLTNIECIAYTLLQVGAPSASQQTDSRWELLPGWGKQASLLGSDPCGYFLFCFLSKSVLFFRPKLLWSDMRIAILGATGQTGKTFVLCIKHWSELAPNDYSSITITITSPTQANKRCYKPLTQDTRWLPWYTRVSYLKSEHFCFLCHKHHACYGQNCSTVLSYIENKCHIQNQSSLSKTSWLLFWKF